MTQPKPEDYLQCVPVQGCNALLAANQDEYETIAARVDADPDGVPIIVTEWTLTPEQLKTLQDGGNLFMVVYGGQFLPVNLAVGPSSPKQEIEEPVIG